MSNLTHSTINATVNSHRQFNLFNSFQRQSVKGQREKMSLESCSKLTATDGRGVKVKWQWVPDNWSCNEAPPYESRGGCTLHVPSLLFKGTNFATRTFTAFHTSKLLWWPELRDTARWGSVFIQVPFTAGNGRDDRRGGTTGKWRDKEKEGTKLLLWCVSSFLSSSTVVIKTPSLQSQDDTCSTVHQNTPFLF